MFWDNNELSNNYLDNKEASLLSYFLQALSYLINLCLILISKVKLFY